MLLVTGIANGAAKGEGYNGFLFDRGNMDAVARAKSNTVKLLVEHDPLVEVGRVVNFWCDDRDQLWATAFIDCATRAGADAAVRLMGGGFSGFSTGYSFDAATFAATNSVVKEHFVELSLVDTPDDADALLYAYEPNDLGALKTHLDTWCDVLLALKALREALPPGSIAAGAEDYAFAHFGILAHLRTWAEWAADGVGAEALHAVARLENGDASVIFASRV